MRLAVVADEYPYRTKQILCCEQIANDLKGGGVALCYHHKDGEAAPISPRSARRSARGEDVSIQPERHSDLKDQFKIE